MKSTLVCFDKDFKFYFQSKMIYLILFVYGAMFAGVVFYTSDFYNYTTVNLYQFFKFQPGILSLIIPALTMRFWADEYKHNTLEVLLSQPIGYSSIVVGKFAAAWAVTGIMLASSFGFWVVTAWLVQLDNVWVAFNYLITFWMAGCLCAVCSLTAALCYNALGAFLAGLTVCMVLTNIRFSSWLADVISDSVIMMRLTKAFDFQRAFDDMIMGQADLATLVYWGLVAVAALWLSVAAVAYKRS